MNSKIVKTDFRYSKSEDVYTFPTFFFVDITKSLLKKAEPERIKPLLEEVARREKYNLLDSIDKKCADIVLVNYVLAN